MKRIFTLGILSTLFFMTSCKREDSKNVAQEQIYIDYTLVYSADNGQTSATALFREGNSDGKKIELSYPARVKFNSEWLSWKKVSGSYEGAIGGNHLSGTLTYDDLDENTYTNNGLNVPSIDLPAGLSSISRGGDFYLPWVGDAVRTGETIEVVITQKDKKKEDVSWTVTTTNATHIVLNEKKLLDVDLGQAEITIRRIRTQALPIATDAGGRITCTYESQTRTVNITQ
jgi:hypothetical protein